MSQMAWNDRYLDGDLPWDTGEPDPHLVAFAEANALWSGRVLEVGCGTGTNAVWLAQRGLEVHAVDIAEQAVVLARARAEKAGVQVRFAQGNFLTDPVAGSFDFVFDRGVMHVFDEPADRTRFAERVARLLAPSGRWLSVVGSTEGPARDHGPPRRSVRDLANAVEPFLEIESLRAVEFAADLPTAAKAWVLLSRKREVPAQPSTRR